MGRRSHIFVDATQRSPCVVCGAVKFCTRSWDGRTRICRHEAVWNGIPGRHGFDGLGERWTWHVRGDGADALPPAREPMPSMDRASPEVLDRAYRALLDALELSARHREQLTAPFPQGRGIPVEGVRRLGCRSLLSGHARVARAIAGRFDNDTLARVPGFYRKKDPARGTGYWSVAASGLLVPVMDTAGRVVACQVRLDEVPPGGSRYVWLSSVRHGGPGPGTPTHVPPFEGATRETVRITEGPLKAGIATLLDPDGILTVGFAGVDTWPTALPVLQDLGARTVHVAFDADCRRNRRVAHQFQACVRELARQGYRRVLELWDEPKGIDDLFASGGRPRCVGEET